MARIFRCFVLIGCLFAATTASAQTAEQTGQDFRVLGATRTSIDVVADTGHVTRGRLLRFDADSLTMEADHREITVDRQHVARVYQRGDPLKNGMLMGLAIGAAWGIAGGAMAECGGFVAPVHACSAGTKTKLAGVLGGTLGALGLGVGAGVDALFTGRRLLYDAARHQQPASISIAPRFVDARASVLVTVAWGANRGAGEATR